MSKGRKTIKISELLDMHDRFEQYDEIGELDAVRTFVSTILFRTDNYKGFREPDERTRRYLRNDRTRSTN